ncbi:phospholipase A1 EG1, chloroplastic/mitochondrial-like [Triticum dicoccoides]|uniref:phospholipase A1 EG1, chloroplastic/mitochondrial-like n=1 Tax=Triticum dicoccoides TaxID=85692 RepID=UPI000E7A5382|nr:phospholipase A1 EG1, chloroplastic/mitochondrial-like [Triticum dicoccoides]
MAIRLPVSNACPSGIANPQRQQRGHASTTSTAGAVAAVAAPPSTFAPQTTRLSAPSTIAVNTRHAAPVAPVFAPARRNGDKTTLASMWREIQGEGDWAGLVEPLHPLLRAEIVRYGELVAATYKAFDLDAGSKRYLNCKYGKARMLQEVGMAGAGYAVTRYIYAAPDVSLPGVAGAACPSRWVGYVAVASDDTARRLGRRDIVVSFRGTVTGSEWVANMMSSLAPARFDPADPRSDVKVESGFLSLYTSEDGAGRFTCGSCRNQLLSEVTRLVKQYKHEDVSITLAGHSMGSSLALLLGYDLAELGLNRDGRGNHVPITVYSFAGPRVGNMGFKNRCDELGVKVLRMVNVNDPITKLPGIFLNEKSRVLGGRLELPWSCACYTHIGVELALDFFKARDPACVHDLEAYLGFLKCLKGTKVKKQGAELAGKARKFDLRQSFDAAWRWQMTAIQVSDLVQSLGI